MLEKIMIILFVGQLINDIPCINIVVSLLFMANFQEQEMVKSEDKKRIP